MGEIEVADGEDKRVLSMIGRQVVGGVIMLLVGAVFSFLLTSSATSVRIAHLEQSVRDNKAEIREISEIMANGGPQPLAMRVQQVENNVDKAMAKIDAVYQVVVLRQQPPRP